MENLILFIFIAVGILQIVMIVKFFQIASDVREIKNKLVANQQTNSPTKSGDNAGGTELGNNLYTRDGENISFSDGLSGRIKIYPGYSECSIITKDNRELLYNNMDYAISALHAYLKDSTESQEGLYTKRKYT